MPIAVLIFAITFAVVLGCVAVGLSFFKQKQKQQIRSMLRKAEETPVEQRETNLIRPAEGDDALARFLRRFAIMERVPVFLDQAGTDWTASKLVTVSAIAGMAGLLVGYRFHLMLPPQVMALAAGAVASTLPFLTIFRKRSKAFKQFEEQFPEALDFLSRSMRAGHGFSVALEMLSADSPDPLGRAFRRVSNDMALGSSMETAMGKLVALMPSVDVRFFVSSVVLQQETGGNLGEILTKLSYIIRERFRLKGQVKAVSAHGRITGLVLLLMPIAVAGFLLITNPQYLTGMVADPTGRAMLYGAIGGQVVGYFVIKKIISIKV